MNNWKETTLGEIAEKIFSGGTPSTRRDDFYGGDIPWLRTQEVNFNYIYNTDIKITEDGFKNSSARWTPENTVVIAMYGNSAGRTAFSKIKTTTNQACCNFVANSKKADPLFIYFNLKGRYSEIEGMANGAAQQNLSVGGLKELKILLPSLPEQREIAGVLSSLDDKIELLRKENETLEKIAQTIFKEWFVDFTINGEKLKLENGIPEGWRVGKLGDEFEIIMGQSPSGESYNEKGDGMIFFQGRAEFQERFPKVRLYTTEPKRIAEKFDVLVSVRAPVGDINVAFDRCCIGRGVGAVRSNNKSYALYRTMSLKEDFNKFEAEGTVFGSINKDGFLNIKVVIPPNEISNNFEVIISPIDQKIFNNYSEIKNLEHLRDTLLPKLMSGDFNKVPK